MTSLTVLLIIFFCGTAASFTQKSECLIHYSQYQEREFEDDDIEDRFHGGEVDYKTGYDGQTGHGSSEDIEETGQRYLGQSNTFNGHQPNRQGVRGYLDEEGEWEDRKRRRKRGVIGQELNSPHTQDMLVGQLSCSTDSVMHVLNVTIGYSNTQQCYQASPGCQAGSSLAKQIIHCQGNTGICNITIGRHYMIRCERETNFALVFYECIPATKLVDICSNSTSDISDALALTSSNYPLSSIAQSPSGSTDIITCECTLRAPATSHLELEYIRTHLPITGSICEGDLLLLERPDPAHEGRYLMEREMCGHNVSNNVIIPSNTLRVNFLTGAPLTIGKTGFLAKFKAVSAEGSNVIFHLSCVDTHPTPGKNSSVKKTTGRSVLTNWKSTTPSSLAVANGLVEWLKVIGLTLPPNFNPSKMPTNFLNLTREELQKRLLQTKVQSQKIVGTENDGSNPMNVNGGHGGSSEDSSSSGVLSGVVASLSSVILILGSLGAFIFYRRHQRKRHQEHDQMDGTTSDIDSVYQDGIHSMSLEPVVSAKNQNRPLPKPHPVPGDFWNMESDRAAGKIVSKLAKSSKEVHGSKSGDTNSDTASGVYSVAAILPDSAEESPCTEVHSHAQASSPNSQSTFAPIAPSRKKRTKSRQLNETLGDYMSPYDNADTSNISTNQIEVERSIPIKSGSSPGTSRANSDKNPPTVKSITNYNSPTTISTASGNRSPSTISRTSSSRSSSIISRTSSNISPTNISRASSNMSPSTISRTSSNGSCIDIYVDENVYGDYSSLHDIQLEMKYPYYHDNTEA